MSKITILGAGFTGLSCAYHLKENYKIYEKDKQIGGLCRSEEVDGFLFDYDGHLLHFKNSYVKGLVNDLLNGELICHRRKAYIFSHNTYTEYPFQAKLHGLPPSIIEECISGLIKKKSSPAINTSNFKQWILSNFGSGIAKHFMIPYNEKFWTISLEELTTGWVDGFIPIPTLKQVLHGGLQHSRKEFGYNINFWYPAHGGIQEVATAFSKRVNSVNTSCEVENINIDDKKIKFKNQDEAQYDKIVSSIPLPELINIVTPLPSKIQEAIKKLKFTSIYVLNLGIKRKDISFAHWIYFPSEKFPFYRIGFPYRFSSKLAPSNCSSIYAEVAYSEYNPIDKKDIQSKIIEKLIHLGIIYSRDDIATIYPIDIKYGYIIYDKNYKKNKDIIIQFLEENNIYSAGRYGSWEYKSMEDSILDGKRVAERLNRN